MRFGIGQPVARREDRFLTGRCISPRHRLFAREAHAVLVFSPACPCPRPQPTSSRDDVSSPFIRAKSGWGGITQGAGQALLEEVVYDRDSGQLLTGTLLDYGIPRADMLPAVSIDFSPVPSTTNPLGAKGAGEGGTVASTPAVMNAILDALAPRGTTDLPMPATPERIWRALRDRAAA